MLLALCHPSVDNGLICVAVAKNSFVFVHEIKKNGFLTGNYNKGKELILTTCSNNKNKQLIVNTILEKKED